MMSYTHHISTGSQMQAWIAFCTQWHQSNVTDRVSDNTLFTPSVSLPPEMCALAYWPLERLDDILQPLQLLGAGQSLRAMSASQFRDLYPHLRLEQLRWALQQMSSLSVSGAGAQDAEGLQAFLDHCERPLGRRLLVWCAIMQVLPAQKSHLGESLANALQLDGKPSDPYRVWIPQTAWAKLIGMDLPVDGQGAVANPDENMRQPIQAGRLLHPEREDGRGGMAFHGGHAINSLNDIDRVRA